jgi:hypothetical protein
LVSFAYPTVLSCHTSLPSFMMLSLACFSLRVVVFDPSRCELTVVRFDDLV